MRRRGNISMQLIAKMLVKGGFDHIVTVDLFSKESLGFFDCNVDNVRASPFLIQYIVESVRASSQEDKELAIRLKGSMMIKA